MRWVLQTPRIWEQETTQPNQPKQTKISPGKRADGQKIAIRKILFGAAKGGRADG